MAGYTILRVEKIKTAGSLAAALAHAFRERETPNADPERSAQNTYYCAPFPEKGFAPAGRGERGTLARRALEYHAAAVEPLRKRRDSVLALEYVVTASPEAMARLTPEQQKQYLADSFSWIYGRHHRDKAVVVGAAIHRDETTPHLHLYVIPSGFVRDKHGHEYLALTARPYTGSGRILAAMQSSFSQEVGQKYGLTRGIEGSRARHDRVKRAYGAIERGPQLIPSMYLSPAELAALPDSKPEFAEAIARKVKAMMVDAWGDAQAARELAAEQAARAAAAAEKPGKKRRPRDTGVSW